MSLVSYRKMRRFTHTPEPAGLRTLRRKNTRSLRYVIQKHDATRLHFDFRLEWDGVLRSWAVPKGPPSKPGGKVLAVEVEDHPIEYGRFEGTIPHGEYGGGTVMVWDLGTWTPIGDVDRGLSEGKLKFRLDGRRLSGEWTLVRMNDAAGGKHNWLLINKSWQGDPEAIASGVSVKSSRSMEQIAGNFKSRRTPAKNPAARRTRTGAAHASRSVRHLPNLTPQLATWTADTPEGTEWLHEVKFDGYRILAYHDAAGIRLITRGRKDWTSRFSSIAAHVQRLSPPGTILDGELVALDSAGRSDFQALQNAIKNGASARLTYYAFDLPFHAWADLRNDPLIDRKAALRRLLSGGSSVVQYSDHIIGGGDRVLTQACKIALEGIISKLADSPYESRRTHSWLKSKCGHRQEFVVLGYTDPSGGRPGVGALLLGYHDDEGVLRYAGRVGTGFSDDELREIKADLALLQRGTSAANGAIPRKESRDAHWVWPRRVVEVRFAGWTNDNLLRQAVFLGFRQDKAAEDIVREDKPMTKVARGAASGAWEPPVRLTNPDRLVFPKERVTKQMLMQYYDAVADRLLPHVVDRPLTILRCPDGTSGKCFFQRHGAAGMPRAVDEVNVATKASPEMHLMIHDRAGLLSLIQMGAIEIHGWGSTASELECPDRLVFDLDPDPELEFGKLKQAAKLVRETLQRVGMRPKLMTTGGKGLHVVVPIVPTSPWDEVKPMCKAIASTIAGEHPALFTANVRKQARRGRIFLDYLRNGRSATAVAPYVVRARPSASVSMPLDWRQLGRLRSAAQFTLSAILRGGLPKRDPWVDFEASRVDLHRILTGKEAP